MLMKDKGNVENTPHLSILIRSNKIAVSNVLGFEAIYFYTTDHCHVKMRSGLFGRVGYFGPFGLADG
jgi:hypothetical protein